MERKLVIDDQRTRRSNQLAHLYHWALESGPPNFCASATFEEVQAWIDYCVIRAQMHRSCAQATGVEKKLLHKASGIENDSEF